MLKLESLNFFNPSPLYRELLLLMSIKKNPNISQEELAKIADIAPSMVNRYIKQFVEQGYVEKSGTNKRNMIYYLTIQGSNRLQFLILLLMSEISQLFMETKEKFTKALEVLKRERKSKILLYGAGVVGKIVLNVLRTENFDVIGFIDDSPLKQGDRMYGLKVYDPKKALKIPYSMVIIASFRHSKIILKKAKEIGLKNVYVFSISEEGLVSLERGDDQLEDTSLRSHKTI